ncbi:hypothetical protein HAX54_003826, partial [Datura stramonium]|nr:hypothetical protein [Datura stramonium]
NGTKMKSTMGRQGPTPKRSQHRDENVDLGEEYQVPQTRVATNLNPTLSPTTLVRVTSTTTNLKPYHHRARIELSLRHFNH